MAEPEFSFSHVAKGVYIALISCTPLVPLVYPNGLIYYLLFLAFLGFGLRPLLVYSGLYRMWNALGLGALDRWDKKYLEKHRREIDLKERNDKYRRMRHKDSRLPKNW